MDPEKINPLLPQARVIDQRCEDENEDELDDEISQLELELKNEIGAVNQLSQRIKHHSRLSVSEVRDETVLAELRGWLEADHSRTVLTRATDGSFVEMGYERMLKQSVDAACSIVSDQIGKTRAQLVSLKAELN